MQIADCRCWINKHSDVRLSRVTPAQVVVLRALFQKSAGKDPVHELVVTKDIVWNSVQEVKRLKTVYTGKGKDGKSVVTTLYPGDSPTLPETFDGIWPMPVETELGKEAKNDTTPAFDAATKVGEPVETEEVKE